MIKLFISYIRGKYDDNFDEGISKYLNNRIKNFKKYRIKNLLKRRITFKEFLSIMIKYKELEELDKFYWSRTTIPNWSKVTRQFLSIVIGKVGISILKITSVYPDKIDV